MNVRAVRTAAAVFIDLENVSGFGRELTQRTIDNVIRLLAGLQRVLDGQGIDIVELTAFARHRSRLAPNIFD